MGPNAIFLPLFQDCLFWEGLKSPAACPKRNNCQNGKVLADGKPSSFRKKLNPGRLKPAQESFRTFLICEFLKKKKVHEAFQPSRSEHFLKRGRNFQQGMMRIFQAGFLVAAGVASHSLYTMQHSARRKNNPPVALRAPAPFTQGGLVSGIFTFTEFLFSSHHLHFQHTSLRRSMALLCSSSVEIR